MPLKSPLPATGMLLFDWQTSWTALLAVLAQVAALAWYLRASNKLRAGGRRWPVFKTISFAVGLLVTAYAAEGGIAHYERSNFTAHVIQLLLLVDVAPPLLAFGAPLRLAVLSSSAQASATIARLLHSRAAIIAAHPAVAFLAAMGTMYVYFLTPVYSLSERHPVFLAYVHLQFFAVGCVLWWVVAGRDALPRLRGFGPRFVLVFVSVPLNAALGLAIAGTTKAFFPAANTLSDTQTGGNVLLGLTEVLVVAALALLFVEWAREEERKAVRADRQLDAALAVARATGSGATEQLTSPSGALSELER
jgi:cytochrome c oxidase assembly factor CtaG